MVIVSTTDHCAVFGEGVTTALGAGGREGVNNVREVVGVNNKRDVRKACRDG